MRTVVRARGHSPGAKAPTWRPATSPRPRGTEGRGRPGVDGSHVRAMRPETISRSPSIGLSVHSHLLLAAVLISARLSANPPAQRSEPLSAPFRRPLETVFAENGKPRAVALVPEDSDYAKVARHFVRLFEDATGARLPTQPEAAVRQGSPQAGALIAFGNVATGPLSLRLYASRLIASDSRYPGTGGFELRTIPFALDLGVNVLFLGGSSPESAQAAADALLERVRPGKTISIPFTLQWASPNKPAPKALTKAEIEGRLADARDTLSAFRSKRDEVLESRTHLIELDLLRGGERLPTVEPLPAGEFCAFICRGDRRPRVEVYAWSLHGRLPTIPVPLKKPDSDATLDLQAIFTSVYNRAGYDYALDYDAPLDPPLSATDRTWPRDLLGG